MTAPQIVYMGPRHRAGDVIVRETPCPDCGRPMVYRGVWEQEHPGLVDPVDESDWRWVVSFVRTLIDCQCFHTLNVERWEMERAFAGINGWEPRAMLVCVAANGREWRA
jgi:hypothetical protein